jgi:BASS family bile acid:Na+ symporter
MNRQEAFIDRVVAFVQRHFLLLVLAAYAAAAMAPAAGVAAAKFTVVRLSASGQTAPLTLPMLLLAGLLLNAGLAVKASELRKVVHRPQVALAGLVLNLLLPVVFVALLNQLLRHWHNSQETQDLVIGLAVVAAMPVAGSSTAWAQHAGGNVALSLGLVVLSTLLSPITTPVVLAAFGSLADGYGASLLVGLGGWRSGAFLALCVVVPSLAGMFVGSFLSQGQSAWLRPKMKLFNSLALLFLCYANASGSLPQVLGQPDWDFLALVLSGTTALCVVAFAAGWLLARLLNVDEPQQRSLMFGLGMNNNGTGLVLASTSMAGSPGAVLPVLAYNLMQHLVAGGVKRSLGSRQPRSRD